MRLGALQCPVVALMLAGCGPGRGGALEGSLSVVLDLTYKEARVELSEQEVSVSFVRPKGSGEDTVLKVTARLEGVALEPGVALDLAEPLSAGGQRGVVSRNVLDDPRRDFPPLQRGRLLLEGAVTPGARVPGEVSATFENGTELASGRTVFGSFEGSVP